MNKKFVSLSLTALLVLGLVFGLTTAALAFDSGGNPGTTGPNTITWTGQGASGGVLDTTQCDASNTAYLLWILTTDGGSAHGATLTLGGSGSGTYPADTASGNTFHFLTPYFVPDSSLTAVASFTVYTTGNGSWNLVISHGCAGVKDLTVSKTAAPSFKRTYTWGISKSVDQTVAKIAGGSAAFNYTVSVTHDSGTDSDWAVTGKITVANPNSFDVAGVTVTDAIDNGGACSVTGGTSVTVPANGSAVLDYACSFGSNPGSGTNTATAAWDQTAYGTPSASASGTAAYDFGSVSPTIVDGSVTVTDSLGGSLGTVSYTDPSPTKFTYTQSFNGVAGTCTSYDNTATFTTSDTGATGSASATVTVCVGADPTVSKTATPSFTRIYNWTIAKSVDKTSVKQVGGTATFNYTVTAGETGFTDSAWAVSGTITVTNPNDWEAITFDATDALPGASCPVTGGTAVNVPASSSLNLPYSCTFASQPAYNTVLTNTATATWDSTAYFTPDSSAIGSATFQFTAPTTTVNKTVTITDSYAGTLGTLTAADSMPFTSATYTYSRTITVPTWDCVTYPNTATIVETGQTASQSVQVCGPSKTGALTMGFWQNKNGQGIITGQAKTGTCPSATWLRKYLPFQDLSATATCSEVASYVTNVIKAANASGASMNAMLKAQMLATALDVYFSDPALGGNKINAPAPIGGIGIDLILICKDIGTCSTYADASSAFGGASKLTVLDMLAYASSQSTVGGITWYANAKATQELAKDAFDAINNQVAFDPPVASLHIYPGWGGYSLMLPLISS